MSLRGLVELQGVRGSFRWLNSKTRSIFMYFEVFYGIFKYFSRYFHKKLSKSMYVQIHLWKCKLMHLIPSFQAERIHCILKIFWTLFRTVLQRIVIFPKIEVSDCHLVPIIVNLDIMCSWMCEWVCEWVCECVSITLYCSIEIDLSFFKTTHIYVCV